MATGTITWAAASGAVTYIVQYKKHSDLSWTSWSGNPVIAPTTTAIVTGLNEGTSYDFKITNNCSSGSTTSSIFTIDSPCTDTSIVSATPSGLSIILVWTRIIPAAVSYSVDWKLSSSGSYGTPVVILDPGSGSTISYTIGTCLSYGNIYDIRVKVNCFSSIYPQSTPGATISATLACPSPTGTGVIWS